MSNPNSNITPLFDDSDSDDDMSNPPPQNTGLTLSFTGFDDAVVARKPIGANSVATTEQINAVVADYGGTRDYWVEFILACADQGSSGLVYLVGGTTAKPFSGAVLAIRKQCTLRQFCMAFAKLAFNAMVRNQRPPANWLRKGHTEETKYAAFDFFNGVTHAASIDPPGGLVRQPTLEEIRAANTNAYLAIGNARARNVFTTNGQVATQQQTLGGVQPPRLGWN